MTEADPHTKPEVLCGYCKCLKDTWEPNLEGRVEVHGSKLQQKVVPAVQKQSKNWKNLQDLTPTKPWPTLVLQTHPNSRAAITAAAVTRWNC